LAGSAIQETHLNLICTFMQSEAANLASYSMENLCL
jgi:hypothetical protein